MPRNVTTRWAFAFYLLSFASFANAAPLCRSVWLETSFSHQERQGLQQNYWEAQNELFQLLGRTYSRNPDPRFTDLDTGAVRDRLDQTDLSLRPITTRQIKAQEPHWRPLYEAVTRRREEGSNIFDRDLPPGLQNSSTKVSAELTYPTYENITPLIPRELRKKYAPLFEAPSHFAGEGRVQQTVHASYRLLFHYLRVWFLNPGLARDAGFTPAEINLLKKILMSGSELSELQFVKEDGAAFDLQDQGQGAHRLFVTGSRPGAPILVNEVLLAQALQDQNMNFARLTGLLAHEFGHLQGISDRAHRTLDELGAKVAKAIEASSKTIEVPVTGGAPLRVHLFQLLKDVTPFREDYERRGVVAYLEDGRSVLNLTEDLMDLFRTSNALSSFTLVSIRDFEISSTEQSVGSGFTHVSFSLNLQAVRSQFEPVGRFGGQTLSLKPAGQEQHWVRVRTNVSLNSDGTINQDPKPFVSLEIETGGKLNSSALMNPTKAQSTVLKAGMAPDGTFIVDSEVRLKIPADRVPREIVLKLKSKMLPNVFSLFHQDSIVTDPAQFQKQGDEWIVRSRTRLRFDPGPLDLKVSEIFVLGQDGVTEVVRPNPHDETRIPSRLKARPQIQTSEVALWGGKKVSIPFTDFKVGEDRTADFVFLAKQQGELRDAIFQGVIVTQVPGQAPQMRPFSIDLIQLANNPPKGFETDALVQKFVYSIEPDGLRKYWIRLNLDSQVLGGDLTRQIRPSGIYLKDEAYGTALIPLGPLYYLRMQK